MWEFAEMSPLDIWYDRIDRLRDRGPPDKAARRQRRERCRQQARSEWPRTCSPSWSTTDGGRCASSISRR